MKLRKERNDEIQSILAEGAEFNGELSFTHGLRVDGVVRGKVKADACLFIGPAGKVEAEVSIRRALINGEFRGAIHAADRVEIHREGRVYGDLYTPCLIIEAGATFDGKCNMSEEKAAALDQDRPQQAMDTNPEPAKIPGRASASERS
jgi:cytoskeletal protein CcmA (bactofilin family)